MSLQRLTKKMPELIQSDTSIAACPGAIVVGCGRDSEFRGWAAQLDEAMGGQLGRIQALDELPKSVGDVLRIAAPAGLAADVLAVVGIGSNGEAGLNPHAAYRVAGAAAKSLASKQRGQVTYFLDSLADQAAQTAAICGAMAGCVGQDLYRTDRRLHPPGTIGFPGISPESIERGGIVADGVNLTRDLVNQPAAEIFPQSFAERAAAVGAEAGLEIEVWDEQRLKEERCEALLAVARGSDQPPRLVIARYPGQQGTGGKPLVLVGKGVTFDSGGLSLKTNEGMKTMKCDMAGAATVLGAMTAIARLRLPSPVIGVMGLAENMVSGNSYKLGDILKTRHGKTVEVLNTDAEGRVVLADALDVAVSLGAGRIVDVATLTGACVVALGQDVAGLMGNDPSWSGACEHAAESCGERVWQLPMFPEYDNQIRSQVGDIKNVGEGRWGGAITAAKFLGNFVGDVPWAHFDIAGPAFTDKPKAWLDGGASGFLVRTLVELARQTPVAESSEAGEVA